MNKLHAIHLAGGELALSNQDIEGLAARLAGTLVRPDDDGFDEARAVWNGQIDRRPALIAQCADARDVVASVEFARDHGIPVAVRGGGHNVAGTAICDQGLVIDLSLLQEIEVDADARLVRVGGGATWGQLDAATQAHALAVPGGVVSKTGIAGLTLNGGIGWLRRKYGLSCDNLRAAEIVTADGQRRRIDTRNDPELFWGIRGGGGNFGVVTRFEFALQPVGPDVMFVATFYPASRMREVLRAYREYTAHAPDELSSFAIAGTIPAEPDFPEAAHSEPYILLAGCYAGDPEEGARIMAPLRDQGEALADLSGRMPFTDVQQILDGDYPDGRQYFWKSLYLAGLGDAAIDQFTTLAAERPSDLTTVDIWHLGGAIDRVDADATAFRGRGAPYLLGVESNWDDPAASAHNIDWTRRACERMAAYGTGTAYLNFEPVGESHPRRAFGDAHRRLQRLKSAVDPDNLFRFNHNIEPGRPE